MFHFFCERTSSILQTRESILSYIHNIKKSMKISWFELIFKFESLIIPKSTILPNKWLMRSMHKNHPNMPHQTYHSAQWLYYVTSSQFPTDVTTNIPAYTNSSSGLTRPAPVSVLVLYKTYERRVYLLKSD